VVDIFGGSNTTGAVAERLRRRWKSFDLDRDFLAASVFRFSEDETASEQQRLFQMVSAGGFVDLRHREQLDAAE
jgi:site-specific DNA-methyltransferase (cytosine-N4-specific)